MRHKPWKVTRNVPVSIGGGHRTEGSLQKVAESPGRRIDADRPRDAPLSWSHPAKGGQSGCRERVPTETVLRCTLEGASSQVGELSGGVALESASGGPTASGGTDSADFEEHAVGAGGSFEGASPPASGSVRVAEAGAPASGSELPSASASGCASRCASRRASRCASRCASCASWCASGSACKTMGGASSVGATQPPGARAGGATHRSPRRFGHLISC